MPVLIVTCHARLSLVAKPRVNSDLGKSSDTVSNAVATPLDSPHTRTTEKVKFHTCLFSAFGPCRISSAVLLVGVKQPECSPPGCGQELGAYGGQLRFNFCITGVAPTTSYMPPEVFREEALCYHRGWKDSLRSGSATSSPSRYLTWDVAMESPPCRARFSRSQMRVDKTPSSDPHP
jgi:hypothetical protein